MEVPQLTRDAVIKIFQAEDPVAEIDNWLRLNQAAVRALGAQKNSLHGLRDVAAGLMDGLPLAEAAEAIVRHTENGVSSAEQDPPPDEPTVPPAGERQKDILATLRPDRDTRLRDLVDALVEQRGYARTRWITNIITKDLMALSDAEKVVRPRKGYWRSLPPETVAAAEGEEREMRFETGGSPEGPG